MEEKPHGMCFWAFRKEQRHSFKQACEFGGSWKPHRGRWGGGSGKGEIILLTPEGSGTEVLGESIPGSFLFLYYPSLP